MLRLFSGVVQHEGLTGRWYREDQTKWASWNNRKSFWPMKRDLIEALRQCGFTMVVEYPIDDPYREDTDRVTIVAVKD